MKGTFFKVVTFKGWSKHILKNGPALGFSKADYSFYVFYVEN